MKWYPIISRKLHTRHSSKGEKYRLVPSSQAYFWNKKNQNAMLEAENDVKAGHIREFSSIEDYLYGLEND